MLEIKASAAPERIRSSAGLRRSRAKTLTRVDWRTPLGKRITELRSLFAATLREAGVQITDMRRLKIGAAAEALATAELVRGRFLRDGDGDLDDIIRGAGRDGDGDLDDIIRAERRAGSARGRQKGHSWSITTPSRCARRSTSATMRAFSMGTFDQS